jgi:hypothetical protein
MQASGGGSGSVSCHAVTVVLSDTQGKARRSKTGVALAGRRGDESQWVGAGGRRLRVVRMLHVGAYVGTCMYIYADGAIIMWEWGMRREWHEDDDGNHDEHQTHTHLSLSALPIQIGNTVLQPKASVHPSVRIQTPNAQTPKRPNAQTPKRPGNQWQGSDLRHVHT